MSLPWWAWLVAGVVGLFVLFRWAQLSFRRSTRRELLDLLRTDPALSVVSESASTLVLKGGAGESLTLNLVPLYQRIADLGTSSTLEQRQDVYRQTLAGAHDALRLAQGEVSLERDGDRILPRLVEPAFLSGQPVPLPYRALEGLELVVVYVLDFPASVAFLTEDHRASLGIDAEALHARALANLQKKSPDLRLAVDQKAVSVIKTLDTFDAARLLLLPGLLKEGEELAVAIPDRDTLALTAISPGGDCSSFAKLAKTPAGPPLSTSAQGDAVGYQ
ncbi:MAG: hypothetical protein QM765_28855 [Myxococcales bacterium]